jgi:hypothetical protein
MWPGGAPRPDEAGRTFSSFCVISVLSVDFQPV